MTTHPRIVSSVLTLSTVALCLSAPVSAAGKDPDDKKASQSAPALVDDYRLAPGDKLRIEVYHDTQMSQSVQIRPDGKITLPLLGDLEATGRTPTPSSFLIEAAMVRYSNRVLPSLAAVLLATVSTVSAQDLRVGSAGAPTSTELPAGGWNLTPSLLYGASWDSNVLLKGRGDD